MPASRPGTTSRSSLAAICETRDPLSGQLVYRPSTLVRITRRSAPSAAASAPAAVSALTLYTSPSAPGAMVETTGIRPASIKSNKDSDLTSTMSPTSPMSVGAPPTSTRRFSAVNSPASSPEVPTASGPWALIRPTSSRPTWPKRTMRTTSMTSGVVTRKPPRNSPSRPSRRSIAEICGPPPCTTTGLMPTVRRNTMSWAKAAFSRSSVMALPPYLITTTLSRWCCNHGRASASTWARCSGVRSSVRFPLNGLMGGGLP